MRYKNWKRNILLLTLIIFFLGFIPSQAEAQGKIRVIVENATIRAKADIGSEIIESEVPIGSIFDFKKKTGDWYEIEIRSRLGVKIPGFLHSMYVEEVGKTKPPVVEEKPKPVQPKPAIKKAERQQPAGYKNSLGIRFGMAAGSYMGERSSYGGTWSYSSLTDVQQSGVLLHKVKSPLGFGICFSHIFLKGLGIQVKMDYNFKQDLASDENLSSFNLTWYRSTSGPYVRDKDWPINGEFSLMPLSLNAIYKLQTQGMLKPYFSAGVSYFIGSAKIDTYGGFAFPDSYGTLRLEFIDIPLEIDESLSSLGFNLGGGFDLKIMENIAFNLDACYYIGKTFEVEWTVVPGSYTSNFSSSYVWSVGQALADELAQEINSLELKTSFFKIQVGVKFYF